MNIAIIDYQVLSSNPIGGCQRQMLQHLAARHDFTVFSVEFDNPDPDRIRWVRVPAPTRPLALLYAVFHILAPLWYWIFRIKHRKSFDLIQFVESNFSFGDVAYAQFCHRAYLRNHWKYSRPRGLRGTLRWFDHRLHALMEPLTYRRVRRVVVASHGLARELATEYPVTERKIRVIPNPVNAERLKVSATFNRNEFRSRLGIGADQLALVFVALGQFERKGLPLVLEALNRLRDPRLKLIVVGGQADLIRAYQSRLGQMNLAESVTFAGMQTDIRPYLWAADAFTLPSFYEVFPLVALEAAAASLPLLVTPLYGVEEFLRDGENGILVERSADGVVKGLTRLLSLSLADRTAMGNHARQSVMMYSVERFADAWQSFFDEEG